MTDTALLLAFIEVESNFNPYAYRQDKNGGSYGLMQIDVETAKDRGYTGDGQGLYDTFTNLKYGVLIQEWMAANLRKAGIYSVETLAAAYNEGLQAARTGRPDPDYVGKIMKAYAKWSLIFPPSEDKAG